MQWYFLACTENILMSLSNFLEFEEAVGHVLKQRALITGI